MPGARKVSTFLLFVAGAQSILLGLTYCLVQAELLFPWKVHLLGPLYRPHPNLMVCTALFVVEGLLLHVAVLYGGDLVFGQALSSDLWKALRALMLAGGVLAVLALLHLSWGLLLLDIGYMRESATVTHPWVPIAVGPVLLSLGLLTWRLPMFVCRSVTVLGGILIVLGGVVSCATSVVLATEWTVTVGLGLYSAYLFANGVLCMGLGPLLIRKAIKEDPFLDKERTVPEISP